MVGITMLKEDAVSGPVVYVSTWKIKQGKFDDYRRFHDELARVVDENEPRIAAFLSFANEDGTEITGIHVFPDRDALEHHMGVLATQMGVLADDMSAVFRYMEPGHIDVYGTRSPQAMAMDKALEESVPFTVKSRFVGGFTRS
jgi:hypothetical protein